MRQRFLRKRREEYPDARHWRCLFSVKHSAAFRQNKNTENYYNEVYRKSIEIKKTSKLNYDVGDRVRHISFGEGTVIDIEDGAKDYKVSVDFDKFGVKKMFAGFAKLDKI